MTTPESDRVSDSGQLNGWKEISAYIGKGVRQAQRWEKLGMPVHRVGGMDGVVFAYCSEVDKWRLSSAGIEAGEAGTTSGESEAASVKTFPSRLAPAIESAGRRRWPVWAGLAILILPLGIFLGYAYGARAPLDIELQSPAEAPQGGSFRFHATGGDEDLGLAHRIFRNPRGGELLVSPPVPRGSDGRFVWVFSTDCLTPPGHHEVLLADSEGKVLTKSVRIEVKTHPSCSGPVPDIQAESISLSTGEIEEGGAFTCRFSLRNQGAGAAYPSMTRLRLGRSPLRSSVTDIRLADIPAPLLRPGETVTFEPELTLPAAATPGVYYVWVVADNNGDNVEALTHNNYVKSLPLGVVRSRDR